MSYVVELMFHLCLYFPNETPSINLTVTLSLLKGDDVSWYIHEERSCSAVIYHALLNFSIMIDDTLEFVAI